MADQLTEASERLQRLLVDALGSRSAALDDWAVIMFAIQDARRYRAMAATSTITELANSSPLFRCTSCGRKSWDEKERDRFCDIPQPNNFRCRGIMKPPEGNSNA